MTAKHTAASYADLLEDALATAAYAGEGFAKAFFQDWFRVKGTALFFLFNKNLSVTNIQFAELAALLRDAVAVKGGDRRNGDLLFTTSVDLRTTLDDMMQQVRGDGPIKPRMLEVFTRLYSDLLYDMVVIDPFYGSAAVFLPPHLEVDLRAVVGQSGYVHSAGRSIYNRTTAKATPDELVEAIAADLRSFPSQEPVFVAVYAHEDFTRWDREQASRLREGLDDVKIHIEKFFLGNARLPQVLDRLRTELPGKVFVPPPGDYHETHIAERRRHAIDPSRTIWLIIDHGVTPTGERTAERYFICYDQLLANSSPFYWFDENKPAWVAHTTIPHTLTSAMINITRPWERSPVVIGDPFVGTGTTWLEALKLDDVEVLCSDLNPLVHLLVEDNLACFCLTEKEIRELTAKIKEAIRLTHSGAGLQPTLFPNGPDEVSEETYGKVVRWVAEVTGGDDLEFLSSEVLHELGNATLLDRLLFYIGLRARRRYEGAYERGSVEWGHAFRQEALVLVEQFGRLSTWRSQAATREDFGRLSVFGVNYSEGCSISPAYLQEVFRTGAATNGIEVRDVRDLPAGSFDVILADPPYGFNTEEDPEGLTDLYREMVRVLVRAVRDDGHLVISLPDRSYTGRRLPVCTRRDLVTLQVLSEAHLAGREVVLRGRAMPGITKLFRPPYYWESVRALRRSILHFRIRDRLASPDGQQSRAGGAVPDTRLASADGR